MKSVIKMVLDLAAAVVSALVVVWVVFITSLQHLPLIIFIALIVFGLTALLAFFFTVSIYGEKEPLMTIAIISGTAFFLNALSYERSGAIEYSLEENFRFFLTAYWGVFSSYAAALIVLQSSRAWKRLLRESVYVYATMGTALFTYAVLSETLPTIASMLVITIPCIAVPVYLATRVRRLQG